MNAPIKITTPRDPSEALLADGCSWCCDPLAVGEYGGDVLCGACADEWTAEQEALAEIERTREWAQENMRTAGVYRGAMIEARLSDAELLAIVRGHKVFERQERRTGGRAGL